MKAVKATTKASKSLPAADKVAKDPAGKTFLWGPCSFYYVAPKGKAPAAFQAECPFGKCKHWSPMYALTTGCKRQRSFKDDVGEERVIRELKHWLRRADEAADREEHKQMTIDVDLEDDSLIVSPPKFNFPDRSVEDVIAQKSRRFSRKRQLPG